MSNLNKPAKELFVDLINASSKRANSSWQDIAYAAIEVGVPTAVPRTLANDYRNTLVSIYDASDTQKISPYHLNYDRIDLLDLTRRYRNSFTFYLPANTAQVAPSELLPALNAAAGTDIVVNDLVNTPFTIEHFPTTMPLSAAEGSLVYCGQGSVTISAPLQHVTLPYIGEMSALGVKLLGSLEAITTLPTGNGYIQSFALPAFSRVTEYVEYYSGANGPKSQTRLYSRYATLSQAMVVESHSTVHLNPSSCKNFTGNLDDYIGKVVQIDEELCLVTGVNFGTGGPSEVESLVVKRALDDTLPTTHSIGSKLYMIREDSPSGLIAVTSTAAVQAKCLAKIGPDTEEPNSVDYLAPVAFNNRLGRPYPVRNAKVNGRWDSQIKGVGRNYTVTWEHHPRFNADGDRFADELGWYEHAMYGNTDPGVEYQVTVKIADGGSTIYTSPRVTGNSHTFEMPAFDGEVILEVASMIMSVTNRLTPSVRFPTVDGGGLAPSLGVLTLIPSDTGVALDVEVNTPGSPVAIGYSSDGTDYPYTISWEVEGDPNFTEFTTNTKVILFADYPANAGKAIRAVVSMTNSEGSDSKTSATFTLPDAD